MIFIVAFGVEMDGGLDIPLRQRGRCTAVALLLPRPWEVARGSRGRRP
jgi:hypothetical protein